MHIYISCPTSAGPHGLAFQHIPGLTELVTNMINWLTVTVHAQDCFKCEVPLCKQKWIQSDTNTDQRLLETVKEIRTY
jgi:hypothetical protein